MLSSPAGTSTYSYCSPSPVSPAGNFTGLEYTEEDFKKLMAIDKAEGLKDTEDQAKYFRPFAEQQRLPAEFPAELKLLSLRFERSEEVWEPV